MRDLEVKWRIAAVVNFYWKEVATVGEFGPFQRKSRVNRTEATCLRAHKENSVAGNGEELHK